MFDWKKSAECDLKDYNKQKAAIKNLSDRIKVIDSNMTALKGKAFDSIPKRGGISHYEDHLIESIVLKDKLKRNLEFTKDCIELIDRGRGDITEEQRKILYMFYMGGGGFRRVMDEFHIEQAMAYRRKDEALRDFTIAMYGIAEI